MPDGPQNPPKGHLVFSADFPSGNLGKTERLEAYEYNVYVRSDTKNDRYRQWFYFCVSNAIRDQRVIFNVKNFSKRRCLLRDCMTPVVRSTSRPHWRRIPSKHVHYSQSEDVKSRKVKRSISFAFVFDKPDDLYYFAYCYPYTYDDLLNLLKNCELKAPDCLRRETLCSSLEGRHVDLITIGTELDTTSSGTPIVIVTSRVHPGESPTSYIAEGMIKFLVSDDATAIEIRRLYTFNIVPMLNPDGVHHGNYRCSAAGVDLNRCWHKPCSSKHPTIKAVKDYIQRISQSAPVLYFIDIHAHSDEFNYFLYGNTVAFDDSTGRQHQHCLQENLADLASDFSSERTSYNEDDYKLGTARRSVGILLNSPEKCYTLEVSFFGRKCDHSKIERVQAYDQQDYMKIGENLARALHLCMERISTIS